jgi:hypothetical protein
MIGPQYTLFHKLAYGLYNALVLGLLAGLIARLDEEIRPAEAVVWSWGGVRQNLGKSILGGLCTGLVLGPIFIVHGLYLAILLGLLIGFVMGLVLGISGGLSHRMLDEHSSFMPNQGMRRSLKNCISLSLVGGSVVGVLLGLVCSIEGGAMDGLVYGLISGLGVAIVIGFREGGLACMRHFTLRVLLWHCGVLPLNLPRFLDYCAERIFLRKIGGGYVFVHRLLLDYFVALDDSMSSGSISSEDKGEKCGTTVQR